MGCGTSSHCQKTCRIFESDFPEKNSGFGPDERGDSKESVINVDKAREEWKVSDGRTMGAHHRSWPMLSRVPDRRDAMTAQALQFLLEEEGATALEYGLLAALIAAVIITAVTTLGQVVSNTFNNIANAMNAAS